MSTGTLHVERRGQLQEWCVVHTPSNLAILYAIRTKSGALRAMREMSEWGVDWDGPATQLRDDRTVKNKACAAMTDILGRKFR